MKSKKLGILDFGYFSPPEIQAVDTLNFTFQFVNALDKLGYSRYWMAEHYNDYCSWTNPELLLGLLAGSTENIRVGAAGIAIYYHNPFRVACSFKMLAGLYPDRIDLGISRGAVPKHMVKHLTGRNTLTNKSLKENVESLLKYFSESFIYKDDKNYVPFPPQGGALPEVFILGGSRESSTYAGSMNTNFSLSLFHNKNNLSYYAEAIKHYKETFYNKYQKEAFINVAVQCTCIQNSQKLKAFTTDSNIDLKDENNMHFAGNAAYCVDRISGLFEVLNIDEIIIYDHNRNLEDRLEAVNQIGPQIIKS